MFEIRIRVRFLRSDARSGSGGEKTMLQRPEPLSFRTRWKLFPRSLLFLLSLFVSLVSYLLSILSPLTFFFSLFLCVSSTRLFRSRHPLVKFFRMPMPSRLVQLGTMQPRRIVDQSHQTQSSDVNYTI